jgi:DNA-directed RNA polymerase sigma subunit (sigma70/sigma32)
LSGESVSSLLLAARVTASLDGPVGDEDTPLRELLADQRAADPSERAVAGEESGRVRRMLRLLPQRHRDVVVRRYGLGHEMPQSHEQCGLASGRSAAASWSGRPCAVCASSRRRERPKQLDLTGP